MNRPKNANINGEIFPINTDFRVALKCNEVAEDKNINDYERALAIIYLLFGEKGLNATTIQNKLLKCAIKYLSQGKEEKSLKNDFKSSKFQLDFKKCEGLIKSSFKYDYGYDPYEMDYLHWYDFYNDLENLSAGEFGNCCALNRVNEVLNRDLSQIKDRKMKENTAKVQKQLAEKYCIDTSRPLTEQEKESAMEFMKELGIESI